MNYTEFKQHLLTFLWKQNDTDLVANLDNLIKMAEGDLTVLLKTQDGEHTIIGTASHNTYELPADYRSMVYVSSPKIGELRYVTAERIYSMWNSWTSTWRRSYSLAGPATLLLSGPYADEGVPTPVEGQLPIAITYMRKVPDFKVAGTSWVADKYLSIYTYAVLRHTAPFLKEDERLSVWEGQYSKLLNDVLSEDAHTRKLGISGAMRPAYPAVVERHNSMFRGRFHYE